MNESQHRIGELLCRSGFGRENRADSEFIKWVGLSTDGLIFVQNGELLGRSG